MWTPRARVVDDPTTGAWLQQRLTGPPGTVTGTVPDGYGAYARILHPVEFFDDHTPPTTWAHVAHTTGRTAHPLVQWHALIDAPDPFDHRSELWDAGEPREGSLDLHQLQALCDLLAAHTTTPNDCYFAMWEGWGSHNGSGVRLTVSDDGASTSEDVPPLYTRHEWAAPRLRLPWRDYLLLAGRLDAVGPITQYDPDMPHATQSPALIWPADRAWVVATEIDFDSTLLAGTAETIAAVLTHPDLEAYPVQPGDSLQHDADHTNT
jgi:hypothetical protein